MGPSGSGKSTLMHLLAGLDRPTSGSVVVDGQELANLDDKRLTALRRDKLGFVFQAFNLVPVLTRAREHHAAADARRARSPTSEWFDTLVDAVGLTDRLTHRPAELSGGQQQRVAIARALISRPAVVFADEPTGNLDSKSAGEVLELLRRAVDEFGQTVIMVTHDASAAAIADRVVMLRDGERRARRRRRVGRRAAGPHEAGRVDAPDGHARAARPQAPHDPDRLRRGHRRRLRVGHVHLHGHDQRVVHRPVRARVEGRRRQRHRQAARRGRLRRPHPAAAARDAREGPSRAGRGRGRGRFEQEVSIFDADNERVGGNGPPTVCSRAAGSASTRYTYVEGGPAEQPGEVTLDEATADKGGFKVGGTRPGRRPRGREALQDRRHHEDRRPEVARHRHERDAALRGAEDRAEAGRADRGGGRRRGRDHAGGAQGADRRRRSAAPRSSGPARSRRRSPRATSTTRSASSPSRCSCSPASPCSSAAS